MKRGNLDRWTNLQNCINLLFFSQLVNELLFDYSIPSNRISTLNSHYLCEDALNAIDTIENNGVPQGTLKPIMEELFSELKKDPAFHEDNHPTNYFVKYQSEQYVLCRIIKLFEGLSILLRGGLEGLPLFLMEFLRVWFEGLL